MKEPFIDVGIVTAKKISFHLNGKFFTTPYNAVLSGDIEAGKTGNLLTLHSSADTVEVLSEIRLVPNEDDPDTFFTVSDVLIGKEFHWQQKQKQKFTGSIRIIMEGEFVTLINRINVESYLKSVISSEMSAEASPEFLKAQTIVARSWLFAQLENKNRKSEYVADSSENEKIVWYDREDHKNYDFCSDDHCQRYQGVTKGFTENAQEAVDATRGLVLKCGNVICDTRFSKACGGITESFENVWSPKEKKYLQSTVDYKFTPDDFDADLTNEKAVRDWILNYKDSFCNETNNDVLEKILVNYDRETTDFFRWKVEYTQKELREIIEKKSGFSFGDIVDLVPVERGFSGRLVRLKIIGTDKEFTFGKELMIRKLLSESHLFSSAFIVDKENIENGIPQKFVLRGAGWGHGVGMCQIGAAVMGERGYTFDEILYHYFKGIKIERYYE